MAEKRIKFIWPDKTEILEGPFAIVKKLRRAGFESYIAGGAVRDALLKRDLKEIDIATAATPTEVKRLFAKTIPTGEKHGTLTVRLNHKSYEVTTFRAEGPYVAARRPGSVKFITSSEKDANRRDFTINALFYDPDSSQIIDFVGGIDDLKKKQVKLVGEDSSRIYEDALRMLRAVRLVAVLGFELERETRRAILRNAKLIKKISAERVKQELDKMLFSPRAHIGLGLLDVVGLLKFILPELKDCQGVRQPKNIHAEGDVYAHTLLALEKLDQSADLGIRYAVLFHDLGKVATQKVKEGKITFYNHPAVGAEMTKKICKRLKFSAADAKRIEWLVRYHLVPSELKNMRASTRRRWGLEQFFADLLMLFKADSQATFHPNHNSDKSGGYEQGLKVLKEIESRPQLKEPILSGTDVMRILRIKPGPLVGKVLLQLEEKKLQNKIKTKKDAENFLRARKNYFVPRSFRRSRVDNS